MPISSGIMGRGKRMLAARRIVPRQAQTTSSPYGSAATIAAIAVVVLLLTSMVVLYTFLRRWKIQGKSPRYVPTKFLKKKWGTWQPGGKYSQVRNGDLSSTSTAYNRSDPEAAGVDRNTSVRSVMTLPAYSHAPTDTERVIGREGERAGMDTVVEFPETANDEESRREEQMESLYQIRLARRREQAERDERRRQRREARERGDTVRLEELQRESTRRATESNATLNGGISVSAATLIAEHQSRGKESRVSSVAYGSLGEVRHDGTRIRANSNDSERGGLLAGAAEMGHQGGRPRLLSDAISFSTLSRPHTRNESISDMSVSSVESDLQPHGQATPVSTIPDERPQPRTSNSSGPDSGTSNSSPTANRFTPDESTGSEDIGESRIPETALNDANQPPEYDHLDWGDAPSYEAAVARRAASNATARAAGLPSRVPSQAPRLPQLDLPSINVSSATEPNTPVSPVGVSSAGEHR